MITLRNLPRAGRQAALFAVVLLCWTTAAAPASAQRRGSAPAVPPPAAPAAGSVERQVLDASDRWFNAVVAEDVDTLQTLETDDFLSVQLLAPGIQILGKSAQLDAMKKSTASNKLERSLGGVRIRTYGNVAILTAAATYKGEVAGRGSVTGQSLTTELWVNENGRWRIAHFQPMPVPARPRQGGTP